MPPILTGDHPLPGNAVINAPVRTIVKWQSLDRGGDGVMPRICAPNVWNAVFSSALSMEIKSWVLVGSRPADHAAKINLNLLKYFRSMLRSADVTKGQ